MLMISSATSDASLTRRLSEAAARGVTPSELHSQRVSFIVSSVSDGETKITPEMVEAELKKLSGETV